MYKKFELGSLGIVGTDHIAPPLPDYGQKIYHSKSLLFTRIPRSIFGTNRKRVDQFFCNSPEDNIFSNSTDSNIFVILPILSAKFPVGAISAC